MTQQPGVDAMRALSDALCARDVGPLVMHLDDASTLHLPGSSGLGGDFEGCEAIVGVLQRMAAVTGGTLCFEPDTESSLGPEQFEAHGRLSGSHEGLPFSERVSLEATVVDEMFRGIRLRCADRSGWDVVWSRAEA